MSERTPEQRAAHAAYMRHYRSSAHQAALERKNVESAALEALRRLHPEDYRRLLKAAQDRRSRADAPFGEKETT